MSVKDDLIAARALIDTAAKWRKDDEEGHDNCCAVYAVNRVAGGMTAAIGHGLWAALYRALPTEWQYLGPRATDDSFGAAIGRYNDHPKTTYADIMALYDRAIEDAP